MDRLSGYPRLIVLQATILNHVPFIPGSIPPVHDGRVCPPKLTLSNEIGLYTDSAQRSAVLVGLYWGMIPGSQSPNHRYKNDADGNPARARLRLVEHSEKQGAGFGSLGLDLRNARQSKGLEISQISSSLKISKRHLYAIEEGDVGALPLGDAYLIGYTRAYARYLGLNTGQCVERLKTAIAEREARCLVNVAQNSTPENRLSSAVRRTLNILGIL